jgi:hypothetical protein
VNDAGLINAGDAAGLTATIENEGIFNLIDDTAGIGVNSVDVAGLLQTGIGNFENYGTLAKTGGTATSQIFASYTSESGESEVSVSTGTLEFDGPSNTFSNGTISGTGTVAFGGGNSQFDINPTISNFLIDGGSVSFTNTLDYSGNFAETSGALVFSGSPTLNGSFAMSGGTVNLSAGATLTLPTTTSFAGGTVSGGTLALNGTTTVTASTLLQTAIADNGTVAADGGTLEVDGALSGNGQITLSTRATVQLDQSSASTQRVIFADGSGTTLRIVQPGLFKSPISGFQSGDTIDLAGLTANKTSYSNGDLGLFNGATLEAQLSVSTPYAGAVFAVAPDGSGGTVITVAPHNPAPPAGTTADMILSDGSNGDYEIYDLGNNNLLAGYPLGQVGTDYVFAGLGDFYNSDTTDMLLRSSSTGVFEVYDISNNNITGAAALGQVGLEWQVAGFGDFNGLSAGTDMVLRDTLTGAFEIYDIANNAITAASAIGQVGLEWQVAGFGDLSGNPNETDLMLRDVNTGAFEVYDTAHNQLTGAASLGQVGQEWGVGGFAPDPLAILVR